MMKKQVVLMVVLAFLTVNTLLLADIVSINDGMSHAIDDSLYQNDRIRLDWDIINNPGTHLNAASGGLIGSIAAFNNASVTMSGGTVEDELYAVDNATVNMFLGSVHDLQASNYATITMTGGSVDILAACTNSIVTVSGGLINDIIVAGQDSTMFLEGDGFIVADLDGNMTTLSYGDKLSNFGTFVEFQPDETFQDYFSGTITGTLIDDSVLDIEFRIYNTGINSGTADIVIIPEPSTVILLGLGGLLIRRSLLVSS